MVYGFLVVLLRAPPDHQQGERYLTVSAVARGLPGQIYVSGQCMFPTFHPKAYQLEAAVAPGADALSLQDR